MLRQRKNLQSRKNQKGAKRSKMCLGGLALGGRIIKDLSEIPGWDSRQDASGMAESCPSGKELINYNCCDGPMGMKSICEEYKEGICGVNGGYCPKY